MTSESVWITEGERERLAECVREPIRTPGTIQVHGVLLVVDPRSLRVVQASDNTDEHFGLAPADLLGRGIDGVLDETTIATVGIAGRLHANPVPVIVRGRPFDLVTHHVGEFVVLEFEPPLAPGDYPPLSTMYDAALRLARLSSVSTLLAETARELALLTGYDRVMVYRFHPDGHGEVVAEQVIDSLEPYLGLHYPASDIPAQARLLYLTKLSRVIASSAPENADILALDDQADVVTDLSLAELRSVSPHHRQFMRNMGQESTVSFSLINDGELIGMITCAHQTPRRMPFLWRRSLEVLANQVALHLSSMQQIERLTDQGQSRDIRSRLVAQLAAGDDLVDALLHSELTVLDLVPADGAVIVIDGVASSIGSVPPESQVLALADELHTGEFRLATNALPLEHPDLALIVPDFTGIVLLPIGGEGSFIAWFRQELAQTVRWLGDTSLANRATTLSPRTSFSAWRQSVEGASAPWGHGVVDASELCRDLATALLSRAESRLAAMALQDPLTGLANRLLLMERLDDALASCADVALLFIDLDHFKAVNDGTGHEGGDAVLTAVADRLLASTRDGDTVARLGGDEFVVLCPDTLESDADALAARIVAAIANPLADGAAVTASVGIAHSAEDCNPAGMLRDADEAMYRAKSAGRNRASR